MDSARQNRDYDNAGGAVDNILRHIKDAHDNIPCVGDDQDGGSGFERPFKEDPGVQIVHVVLFGNELDQLKGHYKGQNQTSDGYDHGFRQVLDHGKDASVPCLRRCADRAGNLTDPLIGAVEHTGQVAGNAVDKDFLQPVGDAGP